MPFSPPNKDVQPVRIMEMMMLVCGPSIQVSCAASQRGLSVYYRKLLSYIRGSLDFTLLTRTRYLLFCLAGILQKFVIYGYIPHTANWAMAAGLPRQVDTLLARSQSTPVKQNQLAD